MRKPLVIALVGPTAVGKTDVSIALARRLDAEIVGCDSMQVYRRMPILSQQPTNEQRAAVPHHLIDCIEPAEPFNVGQYRRMALETIAGIHRRGKTALLVGGTGLYLKALTHGLCDAPPRDAGIRQQLEEAMAREGGERFHERLQRLDPLAASKIHPRDNRRLVRAFEVYELTGRPLSAFWKRTPGKGWLGTSAGGEDAGGPSLPMTLIGLTREREELYARINHRVERMIREDGVLDEARRVLTLALSQPARQVHGLAFLEAHLRGGASLEETIQRWQQQVRQYARRQMTWFRAHSEIQWVTMGAEEPSASVVERIERLAG
jgi:tRNA dimethylallyltransferase